MISWQQRFLLRHSSGLLIAGVAINFWFDQKPYMKKIAFILALFVYAGVLPVEAKKNNNKQNQKAQQEKKKEAAERAKKDRMNQEIEDYIAGRDKNKDKSLTLEEFVAGESDAKAAEAKFTEYNKNRDRYLSKTEVKELLGLGD